MYGVPGVPMLPPDGQGMSFPMEIPKNLFRYGEQTIWSTQLHPGSAGTAFALANGTFRLFTTPLGQVGQGFTNALSIGETNIKEGGRIPSAVAYDVFGIAAHVMLMAAVGDSTFSQPINNTASASGTGTAALVNIVNSGVLSWDFTQTQVDIAPVSLVGAGGGTFGCVNGFDADTAFSTGNENNGNGSVWLYRKHPVALPGNSTFSIVLRYGSRAAPLAATDFSVGVKVVLLGYYKNVIEIG